jgi:Putative peptidoglycan binding domain/HlyD family secretion protein
VSARRRRGRGLLAAGLAVVVVAGGGAAYLLSRGSGGDGTAQPQLQTAVARRTELRQTVDAQFTMSRSQSFSLKAPSAGTVTRIRLTEGEPLPSLEPLVEINGEAFYGIPSATPFYRDLSEGDSGDDVKALQAALRSAGHDPGDADGDFGSQTATALEDWQGAKGLDETGQLSLSRFVSFPPGSIVLDLPIAVGDRLGTGGSLATVGGARAMVAQADVGQQDVVQLKTGQQAELTFDAMPSGPVAAKVTTIALDAETQSSSAGSSNPVEYSVERQPTRLPSTVRAGMTGQVSVIVVDLRNVVVVPTAAVGGTGGQPTVQVLENGLTRLLPVVVGLSTSSGVQILAGLQAGQTVVTGVVGSDAAASPQANQGRGAGLFGGGAAPGGAFFGGGSGAGAGGGGASGGGASGGGTGRGTTGKAGGQGSGGP